MSAPIAGLPTMEEVQGYAAFAEAMLKELLGVKLPPSLADAIGGDFTTAGEATVKKWLGLLGRKELKAWSQRLIPIERAAQILADFEQQMVSVFVLDPQELMHGETAKALKKWSYITTHAGELMLAAWSILRSLARAARPALRILWLVIRSQYIPWTKSDVDQILRDLGAVAGPVSETLWKLSDGVVAQALIGVASALGTVAAVEKLMQPVKSSLGDYIARAQSEAFPRTPANPMRVVRRRTRKL